MALLHLDLETFSPLDLRKVGLERYLRHGQTEVLLHQWAVDDSPVQVREGPVCEELYSLLMDERYTIAAFNAPFERKALRYLEKLRLPVERFICSMARAYHFSFAGTLGDVCRQLGLAEEESKLADGARLVRKFTRPRTPSAKDDSTRWTRLNATADWERFLFYAELDVVASRAILRALAPYPWVPAERAMWVLDQHVNDTGWPLDLRVVERACTIYQRLQSQVKDQLKALTGLANPNSLDQMTSWLSSHGFTPANLQKEYLAEVCRTQELPPVVRQALTLRAQTSRSTPDKFLALKRTQVESRVHNTLQFAGAQRTNRWSGRIFQPQNLYSARGWQPEALDQLCQDLVGLDYLTWQAIHDDPIEALSAAIRPSVTAPEGKLLVVVDLASIESRVLGWLCNSRRILGLLKAGKDAYKDLASRIFGVPYDEVTKEQRTFAKPPELGCGYMLSGPRLVEYAGGMGVEMTEAEARRIVSIWRAANPEVVNMWEWYAWATRQVVADTTHRTVEQGYRVRLRRDANFLMLDLPSGRTVYYREPYIAAGKYGPQVRYYGRDDTAGFKGWGPQYTHGGKWVENTDQSYSRDILVRGMLAYTPLLPPGAKTVGSVHDEVVVECWEEDAPAVLDLVVGVLSRSPPEALDLPLGAEGHIMKRYKKL